MATLRENFAANLRRLMQVRGLDQKTFAKEGHFAEGVVSRWMTKQNFPADKQIDRIVAFLGCSYEELVQDPAKAAKVPVPIDASIRELARRAGYEIVKKN